MSNVLIRQSVQRDGEVSYLDLDMQTQEVTLGSAASNVLRLSGKLVAPLHASIFVKKGQLWVKCHAKHKLLHNGRAVRQAKIHPGDTLELGNNKVTVLRSPPGFDFGLQLDADAAPDAEAGPETGDNVPSVRGPAWVIGVLTLVTLFVLPLLAAQYQRSNIGSDSDLQADKIWSSGELHPAHEWATGGDCASCHEAWFSRTRDTACLACHTDQLGHVPLEHPEHQALQSQRCASCHQEHNGQQSLLAGANPSCQSCHSTAGFVDAHPEFENYPAPRRTGILFDHASHKNDHFLDTLKPFACDSCHQMDAAGQHQNTASFETMCLDCHGEKASSVASKVFHHGDQIVSTAPVAFFVLPRLDLKSLAAVDIGAWPDGSKKGSRNGLTKLGLTPFMELLLATNPASGAALARLNENKIKLSSLKKASDADLADAATIIWSVKQLLLEMTNDPEKTLVNRLSSTAASATGDRQLAALTGQMTEDFVKVVTAQWFAEQTGFSLEKDLQQRPEEYGGGERPSPASKPPTSDPTPGIEWIRTTPWREHKYTMQYQPGGHADSFARAWLDLSLKLSQQGEASQEVDIVQNAAQKLFDGLADLEKTKPGKAKGVGACSKCHTLAPDHNNNLILQWVSETPDPLQPTSSPFNHAAHLVTTANENCLDCHVLDTSDDFLSSYQQASLAPEQAVSNFTAIEKEVCASCHTEGGRASSECTDCHNYHVTPQKHVLPEPKTR